MKRQDALSVGEIINRAIAATGNRDEYLRQQAVFLWAEVVGPTINRQTTRRWMDHDTLHVCIASAVLKNELSYHTAPLMAKINELLGSQVVAKIIIH